MEDRERHPPGTSSQCNVVMLLYAATSKTDGNASREQDGSRLYKRTQDHLHAFKYRVRASLDRLARRNTPFGRFCEILRVPASGVKLHSIKSAKFSQEMAFAFASYPRKYILHIKHT